MYQWKSVKTDGPPSGQDGDMYWTLAEGGEPYIFEWWSRCQMFGNSGGGDHFSKFTHYAAIPVPDLPSKETGGA